MDLFKTSHKLQKIKLIVSDVDGTLTDGGMYYSAEGDKFKRFNVKDGMGVTLLKKAGFKVVFLTSENTPIVESRANKLEVDKLILHSHNKTQNIKDLAFEFDLELDNIAFIGDDVNDLQAMKIVGFTSCPADAHYLIKKQVDYICDNSGGHGAFRELADLILTTNDKQDYLEENW